MITSSKLTTCSLNPFSVISFFREANFKTLTMRPFFDEYLPTKNSEGVVDKELLEMKNAGTKEGDAFLSKYLYRMQ